MTEHEALKIALNWGKAVCAKYRHDHYIFDHQYILKDEQALEVLYRMMLDREAERVAHEMAEIVKADKALKG